ncbi:phosphate/phosphite/phosphonate ABC transporter substrate-binding protein [Tropicimonas sp. IMCC6043]|uniref:phosphate/phosphite/phosphonate ABC transporter substrate-binding protein n=1 Tax=Tropicimonas sp. IMCC6043 TaxID=2510645 RepID=UPI00101BA198|nr:PhnD/SsuA/transferrin family substrate-binding protein [Tropicimonas sp. IMCC6043]RYH08915.1 hypothetical protein EU800_14365 [Tropicimonas sp. IMCC6043]
MFAALPMYDHPGVRRATDALWAEIRDRLRAAGIDAPDALRRGGDHFAEWQDPELLLGQACCLPFRTTLDARVGLIGTIDYGLPDIPSGYYVSAFVARRSDPRNSLAEFAGATLAFNESHSHSGWGTACAAPVHFGRLIETGSHRNSCLAIAEDRAEIGAIDAISLRLLSSHSDVAADLKIVGWSAPQPGQALITAYQDRVPALRSAIETGIATLAPANRSALGIRGFVRIDSAAYRAVPIPPSPEAYGAVLG